MYEHNALGYWSGLTLCLTKVRSSRARCPATALIFSLFLKIVRQNFGRDEQNWQNNSLLRWLFGLVYLFEIFDQLLYKKISCCI